MSQGKKRTLSASLIATLLLLSSCRADVSGTPGSDAASGSGSGGNKAGGTSTGGQPGSGGSTPVAPGSGGSANTGGSSGGRGGNGSGGSGGGGGGNGSGGSARDAGAADRPTAGGAGGSAGGATGGTTDAGSMVEAATQLCVDTINMYRATLGLAPYARWNAQEACVAGEALKDSQSGVAHSAFGMCSESAQDECPDWTGSLASIVTGCLAQMWAEGPGTDFATHGHYINMSNPKYTMAACGFATAANGHIWAGQNFR